MVGELYSNHILYIYTYIYNIFIQTQIRFTCHIPIRIPFHMGSGNGSVQCTSKNTYPVTVPVFPMKTCHGKTGTAVLNGLLFTLKISGKLIHISSIFHPYVIHISSIVHPYIIHISSGKMLENPAPVSDPSPSSASPRPGATCYPSRRHQRLPWRRGCRFFYWMKITVDT